MDMTKLGRGGSVLIPIIMGFVLYQQAQQKATKELEPEKPQMQVEQVDNSIGKKRSEASIASVVLPPPPIVEKTMLSEKIEAVVAKPSPPKMAVPNRRIQIRPLQTKADAQATHERPALKALKPMPTRQVKPLKPITQPTRTLTALRASPQPDQSKTISKPKPQKRETPRPLKASGIVHTLKPSQGSTSETLIRTSKTGDHKDEAIPGVVKVDLSTSSKTTKEGRTLLRLLEHGSGPQIEIVWPDRRGQRERLSKLMRACYGMKTALLDSDKNLYVAEGIRGQKWDINFDRFSGFVRQPTGKRQNAMEREAQEIRRFHALPRYMQPVRIFPRSFDAALLGGLRVVLGSNYLASRQIHAEYRLDGSQLYIDGIHADGKSYSGQIAFPSKFGCG